MKWSLVFGFVIQDWKFDFWQFKSESHAFSQNRILLKLLTTSMHRVIISNKGPAMAHAMQVTNCLLKAQTIPTSKRENQTAVWNKSQLYIGGPRRHAMCMHANTNK